MNDKALDLFAGAGGWDIPATRLGWDVDRCEIMPEAIATAEAAGMATRYRDVRDLRIERGRYRLLIASPPCQTFSAAGNGAGRRELDVVLQAVRTGVVPEFSDPRTALVVEPLRLILEGLPEFVALEQVPAVLPVWQAYEEVLRAQGYSTWSGVLRAEMFGVPQTRKRAILIARRDGIGAAPPAPTHSRFYERDRIRLDPGVKPWVSMAEALGWGMSARPSMTVCGGGVDTGGAEPFGNAARQGMRRELEAGRWVLRNGNQEKACARPLDEPAGTLPFGQRANWVAWVFERPATPVQGDPRIAAPGRRDRSPGSTHRQFDERTVKVTIEEAAALQTFPADWPWQGTKGKRFLQVGNAIPCLLAEAVLSTFTA